MALIAIRKLCKYTKNVIFDPFDPIDPPSHAPFMYEKIRQKTNSKNNIYSVSGCICLVV